MRSYKEEYQYWLDSPALSEDEWKAQRDRWLQQGGQKVIDELNKAYEEDDSVQK